MAAFPSPDLSSAWSSPALNSPALGSPALSSPSTVFSGRSDITMSIISTATSCSSLELPTRPGRGINEFARQPTDQDWAERLMLEHCSGSDSARKSSVSNYKAATAALSRIADGAMPNATPGLVQALLDNDADVCFVRRKSANLFKKMMGKNQEDVRGDLLERATLNCSSSILLPLMLKADEPSLDRALPIAMSQNDDEKVTMLRIKGADAGPLCEQFIRSIDSGAGGMVKSLVSGFKGACQKCRDDGLVRAAKLGFGSIVQILLNNGADVDFGNGTALMATIENGWDAIATTIISHQAMSSHHDLLDKAVLHSYNYGRPRVLEECLKAGAQGPATGITLIHTIRKEQHELAETLVRYGASIEYNEAESLATAIGTGKPELLRILLSGKPTQSSIAAAFHEVTKISDIRVAQRMVELLILAGLRGDHVNDMLVRSLDGVSMVGDEQSRYELLDLLLRKGGADVNSYDGRPLALAAARGWVKILELLISCRPQVTSLRNALEPAMRVDDPGSRMHGIELILAGTKGNTSATEHLKAAGLALAARSQRLDILEHLVQSGLSTPSINAGFAEAISGGGNLFKPKGLEIIQFFLQHGVSGSLVDEAFCQAVRLFESNAIQLLADSADPAAVNKALRGLIEYSDDWHAPDERNNWLVEELLELGANGEAVSFALVRAIQAYVSGRGSEVLVDTLLGSGAADVNYNNAEALKIAARAGNASLLRKLATEGATRETLTQVFAEAVAVELEEDTVLGLIDALILDQDNAEGHPDFCTVLPGRSPPIIECLIAHPESVKLVTRLAQLGCDLEAQCDTVLFQYAEPVAVLMWSLKVGSLVSGLAIEALIDAKGENNPQPLLCDRIAHLATANVQVKAPLSGVTPLILAAMSGRVDVVKRLIKASANTLARDHWDRTALYYAAQAGNLDTVKLLLKAKFRENDGSLHEAARELHGDVVTALIKAGYSTNFPSSRPEHNGRTPIQELAYKCDGTRSTLEIESTLLALKQGKPALLDKWQGKNPIFLALENSYAVTLALLDIVMWPVINHEDNVFVDLDENGKRLFFSPTMYMRFYRSQASGHRQLEELLRTKRCPDRYYAELGAEQPQSAVGLPDDIEKEDKRIRAEAEKRRKREQEHQDKLRWESEEAALKRGNIALLHHHQIDQQAEKNAVAEQSKARTAFINQSEVQRKQQLELSFQQQISQQKLEQARNQNRLAIEAQRQKMLLQQAARRS